MTRIKVLTALSRRRRRGKKGFKHTFFLLGARVEEEGTASLLSWNREGFSTVEGFDRCLRAKTESRERESSPSCGPCLYDCWTCECVSVKLKTLSPCSSLTQLNVEHQQSQTCRDTSDFSFSNSILVPIFRLNTWKAKNEQTWEEGTENTWKKLFNRIKRKINTVNWTEWKRISGSCEEKNTLTSYE